MVHLFIDGARRRSRWDRAARLLRGAEVAPGPADQVVTRDVMLTALGGLPPRACVVLRYCQDLPVAQVASALGMAEGTVKRHLSEGDDPAGRAADTRRERVRKEQDRWFLPNTNYAST